MMPLYDITPAGYVAYFPDVTVQPSVADFDYKEATSVDLFKGVLPQPVPTPSEYNKGAYYKTQFDAALYEQIRYFTDNPNLDSKLTTDTTEFKILGYSEKAAAFNSRDQMRRVSPNAWLKLKSICLTKMSVPTIG